MKKKRKKKEDGNKDNSKTDRENVYNCYIMNMCICRIYDGYI